MFLCFDVGLYACGYVCVSVDISKDIGVYFAKNDDANAVNGGEDKPGRRRKKRRRRIMHRRRRRRKAKL